MKINWSIVPFGTMFNYGGKDYIFLRYAKDLDYAVRCICNDDLAKFVDGEYVMIENGVLENAFDYFLNPEDNEKYAIKEPKKVIKYFCHCGEELSEVKRIKIVDNASKHIELIKDYIFYSCKKCGLVYEGKTYGIPKEVEE